MSGWGSKGHTSQGNREYNPDSAGWDFAPVRENSDGSQQHASFFTDAGKPVFTNPGMATSGGATASSASGGTGPGNVGVGGRGGAGPGSAAVVTGPLDPKLQPTYTQLKVGGSSLVHHPGWSDAGEAEERYGDGDSIFSPTFMYQWLVTGADAYATGAEYLRSRGVLGVPPAQRKANAEAIGGFLWSPTPAIVNGGLPKQEPVDWGR